ncbi:hypothetical protein M9H77_12500 [Catharanthus roseus]|uniref:Uncharacterized protein n=1 Tax=Catharanthus roseus TaxID=4058 RepID=A0ACC0BHJ2_CATRO|nr:hypothetical protein M9H77_12500 [Catharanthus roseus]
MKSSTVKTGSSPRAGPDRPRYGRIWFLKFKASHSDYNSFIFYELRRIKYMSIGEKDGKPRAECLGCKKVYIAGGSTHGTSTLKRHIDKCLPLRAKFRDVGNDEETIESMLNESLSSKVDSNLLNVSEDEDDEDDVEE